MLEVWMVLESSRGSVIIGFTFKFPYHSPISHFPHLHSHTTHTHRVHMPSVTYLRLDGSVAPNARFGIVQK